MPLWATLCLAGSTVTLGQWTATGPTLEVTSGDSAVNDVKVVKDGDHWLAAWLVPTDEVGATAHTRRLGLSLDPVDNSNVVLEAATDVSAMSHLSLRGSDTTLPRLAWEAEVDIFCAPDVPDCDLISIHSRAIDSQRGTLTEAIRVTDGPAQPNADNEGSSPALGLRSDGRFLVAWVDDLDQQVRARAYGPDGTPDSEATIVAEAGPGYRIESPVLAERPGDGYLAVWLERSANAADGVLIRAKFPDSQGGGDGEVMTLATAHPQAVGGLSARFAPDGRGLIAWLDARNDAPVDSPADRVLSLAVSPAGTLAPTPRTITLDEDGLRGLELVTVEGGFAAAWLSLDTLTLEARRVSPNGEPEGPISTLTRVPDDAGPWDLASDGERRLVLAWADSATSVAAQRFGPDCGADILCLGDAQRFHVEVDWSVNDSSGRGTVRDNQTLDTGSFWFFSPNNVELVVKVLDGRSINGFFWVFYGSLTDVSFRLQVTDTITGRRAVYVNSQGDQASFGDTRALAAN